MRHTRLFLALCILFALPLQGPFAYGQTTTTSQAPGIKTGKTLWVDGTNGNNTSAKRGRMDKPYQTIQAAINAATSYDTVQVRSGEYAENVTLHNLVNVAFDPGARFYFTSGSGVCLTDGGTSIVCTVTGLTVDASGPGEIQGVEISGASSDITIGAEQIVSTSTGGSGVLIDGGTVRLTAKKIKGDAKAIAVTAGTLTLNCLAVETTSTAGSIPLQVTGGTMIAQVGTITPGSTTSNAIYVGTGTATIGFQKIVDTALSATQTVWCFSGTLYLTGGTIARTTTGDGIKVDGGTCTIEAADITGTFASTDVALKQTGGTLYVTPAVHWPAGETSGTITYKNLLGTAVTAAGLALLDDAAATNQQTTLGLLKAYKTSTTSRVNNTVAADPDLTIAVAASGVYKFRAFIPLSGSTGGFQGGISLPTSPTNTRWTMKLVNYTGATFTALAYKSAADTTTTSALTVANNYVLEIEGLLENGVNAGAIAFYWAQQTTNATSTNVLSGAWLTVEKLN